MKPYELDELYNVIFLGTAASPGIVTLSGHNRDKSWDIKAAKGQTGASTTLNGDPIGQFTATFYLAGDTLDGNPDDFDKWEDFRHLIESMTAGPKPIALPIYHPDLASQRITEVTNGGIGGMVHDGKGGATVSVKFLEYRPPKPKPAVKAAAKPARVGTTTVEKPDPNAGRKLYVDGLRQTAFGPDAP
jgi:hypothetical protein